MLEEHAEKGTEPVDWAQACAEADCDVARVADLNATDTKMLEEHAEKGTEPVDWAQACAEADCDDGLVEIVRLLAEVP